MAGLIFRFDHAERVLRSVGDRPNGIVGTACPDEVATFSVDPLFQPVGMPSIALQVEDEGINPATTAIELDVAVAALEGPSEAQALWSLALQGLIGASHYYGAHGAFNAIRSYVDLLEQTAIALDTRAAEEGWS